MAKPRTVYETKDGRTFKTSLEADQHDFRLTMRELFPNYKPRASLERFISVLISDSEKQTILEISLRQLRVGGVGDGE